MSLYYKGGTEGMLPCNTHSKTNRYICKYINIILSTERPCMYTEDGNVVGLPGFCLPSSVLNFQGDYYH